MERRIEYKLPAYLRLRRRRHSQLEHEPIASRRSKLKRLFLLDTIAVGEHRHVRKPVFAVERGYRAFRHGTQQQRLDLRPRAIYLVEEERHEPFAVAKEWSGFDTRLSFRIDVGVVDEVSGHEIDGALDSFE